MPFIQLRFSFLFIFDLYWTSQLVIKMLIVSSTCSVGSPDPSAVSYGSGTIQFTQKSFCSNSVCNDITICEVVGSSGEKKYYVPLHGIANESKVLFQSSFSNVQLLSAISDKSKLQRVTSPSAFIQENNSH